MNTKDVERIEYDSFDDALDIYLHHKRYSLAISELHWDTVLDLWCGYGFGTKLMASQCPDKHFTAIDIDEEVILYAKNHNQLPNITYTVMSATDLTFENAYFDTITSIENIEHIPNDQNYISEAFRVLKNNGKFIITTPNDNRLWHRIKRLLWLKIVYNMFHIREYNLDQLNHILQRHQFSINFKKWIYINILPKSLRLTNKIRQIPFFYKCIVNHAHCSFASYMFVVAIKKTNLTP
jgi:2-polyprenyl-3-methyl-5-hydroxy-6-metoxy-1,4-benzoquinol methylase